jgi:hypothetical protein
MKEKKYNKIISAIHYNDIDKIEKYLSKGVDPNYNDGDFFFEAMAYKRSKVLKLLAKYDKEKNMIRHEELTLNAMLGGKEWLDCLKVLLRSGLDVESYANYFFY